jgi:hypothetical protein
MQDLGYAASFNELIEICRERTIAVQTIKSVARRPWKEQAKTFNTYFYEPLEDQDSIEKSVHWALGLQDSFVITAGDIQLLPKMLDAACRYEKPPSDVKMKAIAEKYDIQPIFSY